MVLYFRDRSLFYLDWYELSQEEIQKERDSMDYDNKLLQLDYSLANLSILKGYKERSNKIYQSDLNHEKLQNDLREWRRSNGSDLDQSVKEISDFYYPIFNQKQSFDCKGYFKLIIVKW